MTCARHYRRWKTCYSRDFSRWMNASHRVYVSAERKLSRLAYLTESFLLASPLFPLRSSSISSTAIRKTVHSSWPRVVTVNSVNEFPLLAFPKLPPIWWKTASFLVGHGPFTDPSATGIRWNHISVIATLNGCNRNCLNWKRAVRPSQILVFPERNTPKMCIWKRYRWLIIVRTPLSCKDILEHVAGTPLSVWWRVLLNKVVVVFSRSRGYHTAPFCIVWIRTTLSVLCRWVPFTHVSIVELVLFVLGVLSKRWTILMQLKYNIGHEHVRLWFCNQSAWSLFCLKYYWRSRGRLALMAQCMGQCAVHYWLDVKQAESCNIENVSNRKKYSHM